MPKAMLFRAIKSDLKKLEENLIVDVTSSVPLVTEVGTHLVRSGGKRIRPALCLLAAHGGPKFSLEHTLPLAEALELIHTASLVHDDVIDNADTRRGSATANAKWGNQVAILSGDYIFARAFTLVAEKDYGGKIYHAMAKLVANLSIGEIIQDHNVYQAVKDVEDYYNRIQKKTADFLETCCLIGADAGGMAEDEIHQLAVYGHDIGMAFQLTDDLLDIMETKEQVGKPTGNDIRQGIVTLPVIRALLTSPHADELERIVTDAKMTDEMVTRALEIVKETDGVEYAKNKADEFLADAKAHLPKRLPKDIYSTFVRLADFIGERKF